MKTLRIDIAAELEQEILDESCEHIHTAWSKKHADEHLGPVSEQVRRIGAAKRAQIAVEADSTIGFLESLHAQVRRRIKSRGVQTHALGIVELNSEWVLDRARSREKSHCWREPRTPLTTSGALVEDDGSSGADSEDDKTVGPGGGLWRAFVRDRSFGQKGKADLHALGVDYRLIDDAERERLQPLADAATRCRQQGVLVGSSSAFGPSTRDINRSLVRRREELKLENLRADSSVDLLALQSEPVQAPQDLAIQSALAVRRLDGGSFALAMKEGRSVMRTHALDRTRQCAELERKVQSWAAENRSKLLGELFGIVPLMSRLIDDLSVVPKKQTLQIMTYRPISQDLAKAVGALYASAQHSSLSGVLQDRFARRCAPILHDECPQFAFAQRSGQPPPCLRFGLVLCRGEGYHLWRFRNNFLRCMKQQFMPKTQLRQDLANRQIVVRMVGIREAIANPWLRRAARDAGKPVEAARQEVWLSIAHMSFNPYSPSWMTMSPKETTPEDEALGPNLIPLHSGNSVFYDEMRGLNLLDRDFSWSVTWHKRWASQRIVRPWIPGNQYVRAISGSIQIWPKFKVRRGDAALPCDGADHPAAIEDGDECDDVDVDEGCPDDPDEALDDPDAIVEECESDVSEERDLDDGDVGGADRGAALHRVRFPDDSTISVYADGRFEAVCHHEDHVPRRRCRLTRTREGSDDPAAAAQGRPLGLIAAWLLSNQDFSDKSEHSSIFAVFLQSLAARQAARVRLKALPGGVELLGYERRQRDGEPEEPIDLP
jgi:hypothetical protein